MLRTFFNTLTVLALIVLLGTLGWTGFILSGLLSPAAERAETDRTAMAAEGAVTGSALPDEEHPPAAVVRAVRQPAGSATRPGDALSRPSPFASLPEHGDGEAVRAFTEPAPSTPVRPSGGTLAASAPGAETSEKPPETFVDASSAFSEVDEAQRGLRVRGRVSSEAGEPIVDHGLRLEPKTGGAPARTTRSDEHGRFVFAGLERRDYLLSTEIHPFHASVTRVVRAGEPPLTIELPAIEFVVAAGRVLDAFGQPVPGARVVPPIEDEAVTTDETGAFSMRLSSIGTQGVMLKVEAEGFLPASRQFRPPDRDSPSPGPLEIRLRRGSFTVSGLVFDASGYPVPSALVQLRSAKARLYLSASTDESGRFGIDRVIAADDYELDVGATARYESHVAAPLTLDYGSAELDVRLSFAPRGTLSGRVVDPTGTAVPELGLMAISGEPAGRTASVTSDVFGGYVLADFVAGSLSLRSRTTPEFLVEDIELEPGADETFDLVIDVGEEELFGYVQELDGAPVDAAELKMRFVRTDERGHRSLTVRKASSDAGGEFRFTGLGGGERQLVVSADGYRTERITLDPLQYPGPHAITLTR